MAKIPTIKEVVKKAKDFFVGNNSADDTALYPIDRKEIQDKELINLLVKQYKEASDYIEPHFPTWRDNRDAFSCQVESQFGEDSTAISINGVPLIFNTAITYQTIQDIVSIVNSANATIAPIPVILSMLKDEAWVAQNIPAIAQAKYPDETCVDYVTRVVGYAFKDITERRNMHEKDAEVIRDVCLCGIGYSNVYTDYDYDTMQEDIFIRTEQPENVKFNPSATGINETCFTLHLDSYLTPFEAAQLYPEYQDEIYGEITNIARNQSTTFEHPSRMNGLVKIVRTYIKDATIEKRPVLTLDEATGAGVQAIDKESGEPLFEKYRKYPNGRCITWLPESKVILDDREAERGVFPISSLTDRKPSWSAIGIPVAIPLRAAENAKNAIYQQMIANMRKAGNVIVEHTDKVDTSQITDEIASLVKVDRVGSDLLVHGAQNIVGNAVEAAMMIDSAKDQMVGLAAASVGRVPTGVVSGVAIAQLQEPTNRVMAEFQKNYLAFCRDRGLKIGYLMLDMYKKGRILHTADEEGNPVTLVFDLGDVVIDLICRNEIDSFIPQDPRSRMQLAMTALQTVMPDGTGALLDRQGFMQILGASFPEFKQAAKRADARAQEIKVAQAQAAAITGSPDNAISPSIGAPPNGMMPASGMPTELAAGE